MMIVEELNVMGENERRELERRTPSEKCPWILGLGLENADEEKDEDDCSFDD